MQPIHKGSAVQCSAVRERGGEGRRGEERGLHHTTLHSPTIPACTLVHCTETILSYPMWPHQLLYVYTRCYAAMLLCYAPLAMAHTIGSIPSSSRLQGGRRQEEDKTNDVNIVGVYVQAGRCK